ncbi:MAG: DNA repair protein RecN [Christensenellaceae bacterium]|nr:DNA repair protein RecN [Christensenellaceae bacterium]
MLKSLKIKNIALIDELEINFCQGFHVLTGETGAGKSIIVDALNLVVGQRADRTLIRSGCEKASVEAIIDINNYPEIIQLLNDEMIELNDGIISVLRVISDNGRNICRISGVVVPLQLLTRIMENLIVIHGQHSNQTLLDSNKHIEFIDDYGDLNHQTLVNNVNKSYFLWHESSKKLSKLRKKAKERDMYIDSVKKQLKELDDANLIPGEEETIQKKKDQIDNYAKIAESLNISYQNLYSGYGDTSVLQKLKEAQDAFSNIADFSKDYNDIFKRLKSSYFEIEELAIEIRDIKDNHEYDPIEQQNIIDRLDTIKRLKRKYNANIEEINIIRDRLQNTLDEYVALDDNMKHYEIDFKNKLLEYRKNAEILSNNRKEIAKVFEKSMIEQLVDLGMPDVMFVVNFNEENKKQIPSSKGKDDIEFLISPNKGEPLKPLSLTASGGELSRIMLALNTSSSNKNKVACIIFDEIDSGISGKAAQVVAEKIALIAKFRQVLCVTHLAQIAAMADIQFFVSKNEKDGRTLTTVKYLNENERQIEIARILGVVDSNMSSGLEHAQNMLEAAQKYKKLL